MERIWNRKEKEMTRVIDGKALALKLQEELAEKTKMLENPKLKALMEKVADGCTDYQAGNYILTDDKAPVELLGMRVIDRLIQEEAGYYKGIYQEKGIKGVLEAF